MTDRGPIETIWDGEVFRPTSPYWVRRADREYARGEVIRVVELPERSSAAHNFYFAAVQNAFDSLPPLMAERFSSPDALRKYCLIKSGHCYSDSIVCPSHADAMRVAAFVRGADEFALVDVKKNLVMRFTPKSQSFKAMGKEEFAKSKDDVLRVLSELLGVTAGELKASTATPTALEYLGTP